MPTKFQLITELYDQTVQSVTGSYQSWTGFLRAACYNYKCPFDDQILIYAQRPDATAVLEMERWNRQFGRWVNRGAKSIAVFGDDGQNCLKLYFDVSDTHASRFARPLPIWTMHPAFEPEVIETLEATFGNLAEKENLADAVRSACHNAVADNFTDYLQDLRECREDSLLEELDDLNLEVFYRDALEVSVAYMLMTRLGLRADDYFTVDEFAHVYEFPEDFSSFYQYIERMIEEGLVIREVEPQKFPLQAHQVDDVIAHMDRIDIAEIVKHQSVMRLGGAKKFEVLFQEFFVAVKDLSMQFNKSIDLVGNKWLFLFLTQTLDRKTISSFDTAELSQWPHRISLNLNLSSVFSKEFVSFAKNFLKDDQKIIVEVQMMDVFNNLPLYFEAKDLLHRGGHQLLIDATSPEMLHMLNIKRLEPDWIKIFWDPIMEFDANNEEFRQLVEDLGREKIILAKSLDEKSVRWGMSHGISAFQGPYIDNLEVAIIRSQCPGGKECNAVDCLKRRRLLAGAFRDECRYKEYLEKLLG